MSEYRQFVVCSLHHEGKYLINMRTNMSKKEVETVHDIFNSIPFSSHIYIPGTVFDEELEYIITSPMPGIAVVTLPVKIYLLRVELDQLLTMARLVRVDASTELFDIDSLNHTYEIYEAHFPNMEKVKMAVRKRSTMCLYHCVNLTKTYELSNFIYDTYEEAI